MSASLAALFCGIASMAFAFFWALVGQASRNANGSKVLQKFSTVTSIILIMLSFIFTLIWIWLLVK